MKLISSEYYQELPLIIFQIIFIRQSINSHVLIKRTISNDYYDTL
jgi:hypothetical protein